MKDETKQGLMKLLGITDGKVADDILAYAKKLSAPERKTNDFALAKALNERVTDIFDLVSSDKLDTKAINKSYVLMVNELKKIYARNTELSDIEISPIWKHFDIIEGAEYEISEYIHTWDNDSGQRHNAKVNKLCIISNKETPEYTPEIKELLVNANKSIADYRRQIDQQKRQKANDSRDWFISEYILTYTEDGTILINNVLKLKKTQAGSTATKLMEQAIKQPNTLFKPELGQTARNISTILSSLGFSGTLRTLFFPVVSTSKGIKFRTAISRATADTEHIDTAELDVRLEELGARTEINPVNIPF
ncbi:MAG: hypothetical protein WDZ34_01780 [Candidatus Saccharimonadales bacterium]